MTWLDEFQAFRAVINQANDSPESWDFQKLANEYIKRIEELFDE